jgi:hypothetical protein
LMPTGRDSQFSLCSFLDLPDIRELGAHIS